MWIRHERHAADQEFSALNHVAHFADKVGHIRETKTRWIPLIGHTKDGEADVRTGLFPILLCGLAGAALAQPPVTTAPAYVAAAGAGDLYERMSSELVLKDARSPGVRSFAQMMISDHGKTTQQVKAAVMAAKVAAPPPKLMPKQQAMIDALIKASGNARERLYIDQQLKAHQEALALHRGYAQSGDVAALKQTAATAVPVIEHHLTMVRKLQAGGK